jgi:ABC-type glycerol-3-phosphate transport system substrate-binding protein
MQYVLEMEEANCFAEEHFGKNMYFDSFDTIIAGNAAVFFSGGADTAVSAESHNGEGSMAIIPFPQVPESEYEMISDGGPNQGWSVTTWTEHKEIALKLIEHIVSPESQQLLWDNTMLPPNSKSLKVASDDDLVNDYLEILSHPANHTTFMAFTDPALAIFQREASNLITGRTTVDQILEKADEAQARALEETE